MYCKYLDSTPPVQFEEEKLVVVEQLFKLSAGMVQQLRCFFHQQSYYDIVFQLYIRYCKLCLYLGSAILSAEKED